MKPYLIKLALWLLKRYAEEHLHLLVPQDALLASAKDLVQAQQAQYPERSGEAKRHQVFAALLKDFPDAKARSVALAIEAALGD